MLIMLSACELDNDRRHTSTPEEAGSSLRSGDILFQDSAPHSGQAEEIKRLTNSRWSHCGIYFERPDIGAVVVEAVGRSRKMQEWQTWKNSGADGRVEARRLRGGLSPQQTREIVAFRYDVRGSTV
jgi:hypothetical protein